MGTVCESNNNEKNLNDALKSIPLNQIEYFKKILYKSTCKIIFDNKVYGTGFFCFIPFPNKLNLLPTLITNNHILKQENIAEGQQIHISLYNLSESIMLNIDKTRKVYTNEKYDITIIEIKQADKIDMNSFLIIDEYMYEKELNNMQKSIYILYYTLSQETKYSIGEISKISDSNCNIEYSCLNLEGVTEGLILNSSNLKVIGMHKGSNFGNKLNLGYLLKAPIDEFYKNINLGRKNEEINMMKSDLDIDEITIIYKNIKLDNSDDILPNIGEKFSKNKLFGEEFIQNNKNKCKLIINGKEEEFTSFYNIRNLQENELLKIKLKGINNINNLSHMFFGSLSLFSLPDINKLNTNNIIDMSYMFYGCKSLVNLPDISKWNTSNVTDMSYMFNGCRSLLNLPDISNWNISNVTNLSGMFYGCKYLVYIPDISKWNTSNVCNMSYMFNGCRALTNLPDISKWITNNVIDMSHMFSGCRSLTNLPDISKWNTEKLIKTDNMFSKCNPNLKVPDKFLNNPNK